jgi:hypothetical protein
MRRTHKLAPMKEQDQLDENLLRTETGSYVKLSTAIYWIDGEEESFVCSDQDRLEDGLIRFPNGSYHPIDSIEKIEESDCFVATAVYGDINAPEVRALRAFRDTKLKQTKTGRVLVNIYESGVGKKAADYLKNQIPSAIPIVKKITDSIAKKYSASLE